MKMNSSDKKALEFVVKTMKDHELTSVEAFGFKVSKDTPWKQPLPKQETQKKTPEQILAEEEETLFWSASPKAKNG